MRSSHYTPFEEELADLPTKQPRASKGDVQVFHAEPDGVFGLVAQEEYDLAVSAERAAADVTSDVKSRHR